MKLFLSLLFTVFVTASVQAAWTIESQKTLSQFPSGAKLTEASLRQGSVTVNMTAFIFDERNYDFRVVDNASKQTSLLSAMEGTGASAGINGGYFHEDFNPVGLLVADGQRIHDFQTAKLLSGVFWVQGNGKAEILNSQAFASHERKPLQAIQCGPNLVREGKVSVGLNATRPARRSIIATDGHGKWILLTLSTGTLADAGEILAVLGLFDGITVEAALNFDGGSSTALWVKRTPKAFYLPGYANVRNYLGVYPKH
ncbi:MAG: phosphodiester glycosidase family protein [Chthoniobacterales bacterium]